MRTNSAGAYSFLKDALGSTIGLTDANGITQTQYSYDPYGNTTASGATTTNSYAYTDREFDVAGLYFHRARYHSMATGRFVSEDPIRLNWRGPNFYTCVDDTPVEYIDSSGLDKQFPCTPPNLLENAEIPLMATAASFLNQTLGIGAGGSAGAGNHIGTSFSYSRQLVVSHNGQAAIETTINDPPFYPFNFVITGGAGAVGGFQFSVSNAQTPPDLAGPFERYCWRGRWFRWRSRSGGRLWK